MFLGLTFLVYCLVGYLVLMTDCGFLSFDFCGLFVWIAVVCILMFY